MKSMHAVRLRLSEHVPRSLVAVLQNPVVVPLNPLVVPQKRVALLVRIHKIVPTQLERRAPKQL
jgi:hypothetical protein